MHFFSFLTSKHVELIDQSMNSPDCCVICLNQLEYQDKEFPLLCPKKCTNVCSNCLPYLKQTSENDSDGDNNRNSTGSGKYLCPKCRAEISYQAFEDLQFMRAVTNLENMVKAGTTDSDMSGAELRLKYSVTPSQIKCAKQRLQDHESGINTSIRPLVSASSATVTEAPNKQLHEKTGISDNIDSILLGGLDSFMSEDEQVYITELMTSGDTRKLGQAAQILSEIKRLNCIDQFTQNHLLNPMSSLWTLTRSSSAPEQRALQMAIPSGGEGDDLPLMPKHVILTADFDIFARHGKVLKFKDDGWDGTIADALARVYVSKSGSNSEDDESDDPEYEEEERFGEEEGFLNDGDRKKNRVLVTAARGQAARAGIRNGDVVTHINNEEFLGNAETLKKMIQTYYLDSDIPTFTMVLNAEQSTADALAKRARN